MYNKFTNPLLLPLHCFIASYFLRGQWMAHPGEPAIVPPA